MLLKRLWTLNSSFVRHESASNLKSVALGFVDGLGETMRPLIALAALALAACSQGEAPPQAAAAGCAAEASTTWAAGDTRFSIAAQTAGADCAQASATLTIRGADGTVDWTESFPAAQVMTLAGARDAAAMRAALTDWIDPATIDMHTTGALPAWAANAETPMQGEFAFYPEEGIARAEYEALRGRDAPLYCFVQGMESAACLAYEDGRIEKIGVQTFPG